MSTSGNKRIARNAILLYIRMGFVLLVTLFTTRIVLNALGIEDYGIYNVVSGFVTMFAFLNSTMATGVQRFYNYALGNKNDYSVSDVYNTSIQIQVLLAVLLVLLLETVGMWYMYSKMVIPVERFSTALWIFQFSVISLVFIVIQIPYSAAIIAYEKMDYFAYVGILDVTAKLGIAYLIKISYSDRLFLYGLLNLLVTFISLLLYVIYAKIKFKDLKLSLRTYKGLFGPMLSFSGWNVFNSFAYMLKSQGLNMLLNIFFGPIVNAARGVSGMVMGGIQTFLKNTITAFQPQLVQSYATGDVRRTEQLFFTVSKVSYILLAMITIPVIIELKYILSIWLGENIPEYTVPFIILVLINMVISSLNTPVTQVVLATGKVSSFQTCTSLMVCSILPISWFFLRLGYDATSVYWVSLFVTILNQVISNILLKRLFDYNVKIYVNSVIIPCALFSVLSPIVPLAVSCLMSYGFIRLLLVSLLSVISSGIIAFFLVLSLSERNIAISMVNNIMKRR